jgi:hypothetical protein
VVGRLNPPGVDDFTGLWYTIEAKERKEERGNMAVEAQSKSRLNRRKEYLVTYGRSMMGKALRTMVDLGVTREIRCYPGRQVLLLEEELEALRESGVVEEEAIPLQ